VDVDAAWAVVRDLPKTAVAVIKHTNPCGAACEIGGDPAEVFRRAKATDPTSSFGGIVAVNQPVSLALAEELSEMFLEVVVAPGFEEAALAKLARKKKLRLLRWKDATTLPFQLRSAAGGLLAQHWDQAMEDLKLAEVATQRKPTEEELRDLAFAWVICKHVKSNAIVYAKGGQLLGVGAGQMSRVDSVKLAAMKAQLSLQGAVMASDAFFPFRDGLDEAVSAGIKAVVQPGGSIRDAEVIAAADEHGVAMIHTGVRHFKH
jgi:phosphoribosylaminoimidazolecarboxamide formyltransferase/IMP cyclohydrolase